MPEDAAPGERADANGGTAAERGRGTGGAPRLAEPESDGEATESAQNPEGAEGAESSEGDVVARVLGQWQRVLPDLDTEPIGVIGRLTRCAALLRQASDAPLAHEGFSRPEFDILSALRREDRELSFGRLARETYASGTAVTKRVRTLEEKGLVVRRPDARDRRVAHLSLTDGGRQLVDRIMPEQVAYERSLLAGLGGERREQLSEVLGELLQLLEGREGAREGG
ncbi:MarR family transcriptional regulator [Streptomyces diacarni]|uniref:MarR family transcriptional regulator n=1 Tax=Streptomyces diacarni TaxID=2800381 RepID=A0A367F181_9ACTN|nr:MarR family transcriptional regulator [Streptomyces diacarni]